MWNTKKLYVVDTPRKHAMKLIFLSILSSISIGNALGQFADTTFIGVANSNRYSTKLGETKKYILTKQAKNSDFDYSKLDKIDNHELDTITERDIKSVFEPVRGQYNYYQFLATFIGEGYHFGGPPLFKEFHDILIIKTNDENKILDAYHYTLEWAEMPCQYDVYKSSAVNVYLTNDMNISQLKLIRTEDGKTELKDNGIVIVP